MLSRTPKNSSTQETLKAFAWSCVFGGRQDYQHIQGLATSKPAFVNPEVAT